MSLIVAIKDKDRIIIGCDSQVSSGGIKTNIDVYSDLCKIWKIENCKYGIMGSVGTLRSMQVVQCEPCLVDKIKQVDGEIDYGYVVRDLCDMIYNTLKKYRCLEKDCGDFVPYSGNEFLFAYKDNCWCIGQDFSVVPIEDYLVIGSGSEVAIGVLENNKDKKPETRIMEAIKSSADRTLYVNSNIVIMSTIEQQSNSKK